MVPRSLRDPVGRQSILDRLARLKPSNARLWGKMDPSQLLPHLATGLRYALPDALRAAIFRRLAIHLLPWPKGKIEAPKGAFSTPSAGWDRDRQIVVELIGRLAAAPPDKFAAMHPMFGRMTPHDWDVLQYRHLDHHLRQFGV
jgi:hypothetical protein